MSFSSSRSAELLASCDIPPVRYRALRLLMGRGETDPEVVRARDSLMDYGPTREILSQGDEFWFDRAASYQKYRGRFWQMIYLGWFLADGRDPRIAPGVRSIIEDRGWIWKHGGQCLTANILAAAMRLGYANHPVVVEERENLARRLVADGGLACEAVSYSLLDSCRMALPKPLLCFGEIPPEERSGDVRRAVDLLVELLLDQNIFMYVPGHRQAWLEVLAGQPKKGDLPQGQTVKAWVARERESFLATRGRGEPTPKAGWTRLGFPLSYNSDILEALYALAVLEVPPSPRMAQAVSILRDKMRADGTWVMENSFNGKMRAEVERKGRPSLWLTYFATVVVDRYASA